MLHINRFIRELKRLYREYRNRTLLFIGVGTVIGEAAMLLLFTGTDRLLRLSPAFHWGLWSILVLIALIGTALIIYLYFKPPSLYRMAAWIEQRVEGVKNHLINALQLQNARWREHAVADDILNECKVNLRRLHIRDLASPSPVRYLAWATGGLLLLTSCFFS